jgi:hypothetical protein
MTLTLPRPQSSGSWETRAITLIRDALVNIRASTGDVANGPSRIVMFPSPLQKWNKHLQVIAITCVSQLKRLSTRHERNAISTRRPYRVVALHRCPGVLKIHNYLLLVNLSNKYLFGQGLIEKQKEWLKSILSGWPAVLGDSWDWVSVDCSRVAWVVYSSPDTQMSSSR